MHVLKCDGCAAGWRHRVGNCVLCGRGPAPWNPSKFPQTDPGRVLALKALFNGQSHVNPDWDALAVELEEADTREKQYLVEKEMAEYQRLKVKYERD